MKYFISFTKDIKSTLSFEIFFIFYTRKNIEKGIALK